MYDPGYYYTDRWRAFRKKAIAYYKKCYVCGTTKNLQTHHLHYRNWGNETLADVRLLCKHHHYRGSMDLAELDEIKRMERWRGAIEYPFTQLVKTAQWLRRGK